LESALLRPLFERLVRLLKLLFSLSAKLDFLLIGLIEARVIDRNGRLCRKPGDDPFGSIGKDTRLRVPEEKATQNLTGP
jgi:hypothetical protein